MTERGHDIIAYGESDAADLRLLSREPRHDGQRIGLSLFGMRHAVDLKLIGDFQAMNVLAALGLAIATGSDIAKAVATLPSLTTVPGRMRGWSARRMAPRCLSTTRTRPTRWQPCSRARHVEQAAARRRVRRHGGAATGASAR